jgi:hypothetical protein
MKGAVLLTGYLVLVWALLAVWCWLPGSAVAFQATNYARVVAQAERIAYLAAQKQTLSGTVAAAAIATNPTSIAVRLVTGPLGWAALGVSVGLILAQMYYSPSDLSAIKQAATPAGGYSITHPNTGTFQVPSDSYNGQSASFRGNATYVSGGQGLHSQCIGDGNVYDWSIGPFNVQFGAQVPQIGAIRGGPGAFVVCHFVGSTGSYQQLAGTVTQAQIQSYVQALSPTDPKSIESHTAPVGLGQAVPAGGDTTTSVSVSPTEMPSTVKQKPIPSTDSLVADNVPPPAGTPQQQTQQQAATTSTVTNQDGSKTDTTTATVACTTPDHEARTFASVLQAHQQAWNTTGLIGAVNLLKTLVWPTTLPTISLPSQFFGTQSVNFNDWAWFFTALRTLVIAIATLASYRIIFIGGR